MDHRLTQALRLTRLAWRAQQAVWRRRPSLRPAPLAVSGAAPDQSVGTGVLPDGATVPRPEHPRPQLVRDDWLSLNGEWEFEVDQGDSGLERGLVSRPLTGRITVPFCPESEASGVGAGDFLEAVWYRRTLTVPAAWAGRDAVLHLGAVDQDATVWANGVEIARHRGGFTPFSAPLARAGVGAGDVVEIVVRARDPRSGVQARGKQSRALTPSGCFYPRVTGIWQSVWLEAVPRQHVRRLQVVPDLAGSAVDVTVPLSDNLSGGRLVVRLTRSAGLGEGDHAEVDDTVVAEAHVRADLDLAPRAHLAIPRTELHPWSPSSPHLYGLTVTLVGRDGETVDRVTSYAGVRSLAVSGDELRLNGRRRFQRLVLDQGWWPHTLMTAPSDEALATDIRLGMAAGFDGARVHQKVAEERYLYHADRLGYLVWGELGDWGCAVDGDHGTDQRPTPSYLTQWTEVLLRDLSHPCVVGWCPLNETAQPISDRITVLDDVTRGMWLTTKAIDPTRPVIDASGWSHRVPEADIYDGHCYEQRPWRLRVILEGLAEGAPLEDLPGEDWSVGYAGQPYLVSEYGGIWWSPGGGAGDDRERSWGYGQRVRDLDEFHARHAGLTDALLSAPRLAGYCYTQLTDTFQEQNGLYAADRSAKVDIDRVRAAQQRPAAYDEREGTGPGESPDAESS